MEKFSLIFFLFLLSSYNVTAQKNTVGFHCGVTGAPTTEVVSMEELLKINDFKSIREGLVSPTSSIRFLSVIILERLEKRGLIEFTKKDKIEMRNNYVNEYPVSVCNGCLGGDFIKLSKLLSDKKGLSYRKQAEEWADNIIEEN